MKRMPVVILVLALAGMAGAEEIRQDPVKPLGAKKQLAPIRGRTTLRGRAEQIHPHEEPSEKDKPLSSDRGLWGPRGKPSGDDDDE